MTTTSRRGWLDDGTYLRQIRIDSDRLAEVGRLGMAAEVPSCPGWTVADVLRHTALVYLHKVELLRRGDWPTPWPPPELVDREPGELFGEATQALLEELSAQDPDASTMTRWSPPQPAGFWFRRMALEVAVHRYDAELAHGVPTPIDAGPAADGVDEALRIFLGGRPWRDTGTDEPLDARIRITSAGRSWTVTADRDVVAVTEADADPVDVELAGAPEDVFLWLWGRRDEKSLVVTGTAGLTARFRRQLAEAMA